MQTTPTPKFSAEMRRGSPGRWVIGAFIAVALLTVIAIAPLIFPGRQDRPEANPTAPDDPPAVARNAAAAEDNTAAAAELPSPGGNPISRADASRRLAPEVALPETAIARTEQRPQPHHHDHQAHVIHAWEGTSEPELAEIVALAKNGVPVATLTLTLPMPDGQRLPITLTAVTPQGPTAGTLLGTVLGEEGSLVSLAYVGTATAGTVLRPSHGSAWEILPGRGDGSLRFREIDTAMVATCAICQAAEAAASATSPAPSAGDAVEPPTSQPRTTTRRPVPAPQSALPDVAP